MKRVKVKWRNQRIKATYESMPGWTLKELAEKFDCSITTVWYAINGRNNKK